MELTLTNSIYSKNDSKEAIVITDGPKLTFGDYKNQIKKLGKTFVENGIEPETCISVALPNGLEILVAFMAITGIKCRVTLLNPAYLLDEFLFYLKDTQSKVILVPENLPASSHAIEAANKLGISVWKIALSGSDVVLKGEPLSDSKQAESRSPKEDDVALILHTSGTTSQPKGVPLTHKNLSTSINNIAEWYKLSPEDTSLIVMPLFHVHGLLGATLSTLHSGGKVVVPPRFSATTFWKDAEKYNVTWYSAVPTIHQILLNTADANNAPSNKLRFIRSCSSALAPVILERLEKRFGAPVLEAYGMTEASHQMASNPLPPGPRKAGSVGQGTNVKVGILNAEGKVLSQGELGEVCIKGDNVTHGYLNNPKANKENFTDDGWFRTGDQGFLDKDNFLTLTGRIKELINRGGEKISPPEIDATFLQNELVAEAVSFGIPDEKYGEEVGIAVVLREGVDGSNHEEIEKKLIEYAKTKLASFKVPKKVFVAKELPKTATGKTQRRFIAAHFLGTEKK